MSKLQEETVKFLSTQRILSEGTDFKGSQHITITRFAGRAGEGMQIQLTGRSKGPARFPVEEAAELGKALMNKKLLKA